MHSVCWGLTACFDAAFQMEEQIQSWTTSARPSGCWGWVWVNWRTTSTTWSLWPSPIKRRSFPLAKTMSCSFPSLEPEMQRKGRITFQITCHPWSPYRKVSTYNGWYAHLWVCVCACVQCFPQGESLFWWSTCFQLIHSWYKTLNTNIHLLVLGTCS